MSRSFLAGMALALSLTVSCIGSAPDEDVGSRTEWIVDGTPDSTPQVVVLYNARSGGLCTATVIAPRVVLTAKHCVQRANAGGPDPASAMTIGVGDAINRLTDTLRAVEILTTPGSYDSRLGGLVGEDIALITLQTGITSFEPMGVNRNNARDFIGDDVIAVGYGQTPSGSTGTKFRTTGRVQFIDGNVLFTGPITCQGDSGGPIIDAASNEVIAVTSFGSGGCGAGGLAGANRVDVFLDMIDMVIGTSGSCLNDGAERCDGFDNDCNGEVDETCAPLGSECAADDECVGLNCGDTPSGRRCTASCDPLRPELSCSTGLYCARVSGCEGLCVPLPPSRPAPMADEMDCADDLDCISLFCADPGDGRQRCLTPCRGDEGSCFAGEACAAPPGACGGCVDAGIVIGARGLGEPCDEGPDCGSGSCRVEAGLSYCTRSCVMDSDCGSATRFHCRDGECIRGAIGGVGDPCITNDDCRDATFCAIRGDISWCTTFCSDADPCLEGYECADVGEVMVCVPTRGVIGDSCEAHADCISGVCTSASLCTRICGPDAPCAGPFECVRTADGATAVCVAPRRPTPPPTGGEGGCSVSRAGALDSGALLAIWALFFGALSFTRRARRRR